MKTKNDARQAARIAGTIATECVGARVRMLNRMTTRIYDDRIRPHGLKFSQMNILAVVTLRGPIQPAQVGRILCLEKSTLSRNVRIMEANGWIKSLPGAGGHTHMLRVTRQGRTLLKKAAPAWRRAQRQVTSLLGDRTAAALLRAAERVREAEPPD